MLMLQSYRSTAHMTVVFQQLETNEDIIAAKARDSLEKYNHQVGCRRNWSELCDDMAVCMIGCNF